MSLNNQSNSNINVFCRFRPMNDLEKTFGMEEICDFSSGASVTFHSSQEKNIYSFNFDKIFPPTSTQKEIYEDGAKNIIDSVLSGYNGTIIAYGQTGSGKTYTMEGKIGDETTKGIIPRMIEHIFNYIYNNEYIEFLLKVSIIEIYQEKIRDLLNLNKSKNINNSNLNIREDNLKGIYIEGLSEYYVCSPEEIISLLEIGNNNRAQSFTNMNEHSSRSHFIFILKIFQNNRKEETSKNSKLFLVDLAGSEKVSKSGVEGQTLEEAKIINKSLTTLGRVINNLTDGKSIHIPYRESKLTRVLQESLGGNSKTSLIITCSPSIYNECESLSTLRFGERAKKIKNKPIINKELTLEQLKKKVEELNEKIKKNENRIDQLEKFIISNKLQVPKYEEYIKVNINSNNNGEEKQKNKNDDTIITEDKIDNKKKEEINIDEKLSKIMELIEQSNNYLDTKFNIDLVEQIKFIKEKYAININNLNKKIESLKQEISTINSVKYKLQLALIDKQTMNIENSSSKIDSKDYFQNLFSEFISNVKKYKEIESNSSLMQYILDCEKKITNYTNNDISNKNEIIKNSINYKDFIVEKNIEEQILCNKKDCLEKNVQTDIEEEEISKYQIECENDKKYLMQCIEDNKQIILELKDQILELQNKNKNLEDNAPLSEKKIRDKNIILENNLRELKKKYEESQVKRMLLEDNYQKLNKIFLEKKGNLNKIEDEIKEEFLIKRNASVPVNMIKVIAGGRKDKKFE